MAREADQVDLATADVVIGAYSSVLYECYLEMVPSVFLKVSPDIVGYDELRRTGFVVAFYPNELRQSVEAALGMTEQDLRSMKRYIWGDTNRQGYVEVVEQACYFLSNRDARY